MADNEEDVDDAPGELGRGISEVDEEGKKEE